MVYSYADFLNNYQELGCLSVTTKPQSSYSMNWKVYEYSMKTKIPLRFPSTVNKSQAVLQYRQEGQDKQLRCSIVPNGSSDTLAVFCS